MKDNRLRYFAENMDRLSRRDRVFLNNPVIMQGLGLACIVVPANTLQNGWMLAVGVMLLLTPTRMIATFIGQRVSKSTGFMLRALIYALTSATVYIGVAYLLDLWFGTGTNAVGIYLPLLVVEPLILKRYESPKRERLITSFKKGILTTLGFCLVLLVLASIRELLAFGTLGGVLVFNGGMLPLAQLPAGGFILLGLLAAVWRAVVNTFKKKVSLGVKNLDE